MPEPRFLQIHFLAPYTAALLNRDDSGLAKRLPYGGSLRTRVSSQCLKRHWRIADDPHGLDKIEGKDAAFRSRGLVTKKVIESLRSDFAEEVVDALEPILQKAVYGDKGDVKKTRQTLLMGAPELEWLASEVHKLANEAAGDAEAAKRLAGTWAKDIRANIKVMRENTTLPAGLVGALFGRMVTSDPDANITAPVHVAHAFTVHAEEAESDYFVAVDDLTSDDETGADTIQETELTSGLFYGYVVVDIPLLLGNLGGDAAMAGQVLHNLIYLIAEVSPGAKLGSTAPYGRASLMLLEVGDRQPRSLAEAYRKACAPDTGIAFTRLSNQLKTLDNVYATGEERRFLALSNSDIPAAERATLAELATWAKGLPKRLS